MVSSKYSLILPPYHGSDLKNVNTFFFFFSGDAKQTLLTDKFNVMRTREHVSKQNQLSVCPCIPQKNVKVNVLEIQYPAC